MTFRWLPMPLGRALMQSGSFSPADISAVSAWLRLQQGTITGSGYSSVPDVLASNPATQGTDASRPPNNNSANSLPIADFDGSNDFLSWPAASNNNGTTYFGFATWFEPDSIADGQKGIICALTGATSKLELTKNNADLLVDVNHSQFVVRRGSFSNAFGLSTKTFITFEFDGTGANDAAKCTLSLDANPVTVSFSDSSGTPGTMPSAMVSTAGPYTIGARNTTPVGPFNGKMGPNFYVFGSKMDGATQGLLTVDARIALMNFEAPT